MLLVSPERLNNPDFREHVLPHLVDSCGLLVVDEAHCLSDWGFDFRPDYLRLKSCLEQLRPDVACLCTTATAPGRVVEDLVENFLKAGIDSRSGSSDVLVLRGSLDRQSLRLRVVSLPTPATAMAWLSERLETLPGSGIVYCLTVAGAGELGEFFTSEGHDVLVYTGRTGDDERKSAEAALLANEVKAVVATSALGMGYDKADLGFVVHFGAPASPVAYYQQVGRAGRGVARAEVILVPGHDDRAIWEYFATASLPREDHVQALLTALEEGPTLSTQALEARVPLGRTRLELLLKVLDVDGAVRRVKGGWRSTGTGWHYDAERYCRVAEVRCAEHQAMLAYERTEGCRMRFLREQLDDPFAESDGDCGRCDNCSGEHESSAVSEAARRAASELLARPGVELEVRSMWPAAMERLGVELSGKIPSGQRPEPGRAVARLSDLGYGEAVRAAVAPGRPDAPSPKVLLDAAVMALSSWRGNWPERPAGVVAVGSNTRPTLVASFATHIATVGKLPLIGTVAHRGPSADERSNSAFRLRAIAGAYELGSDLRAVLGGDLAGRPLFLLDDYVDTGWTIAVVARLLRLAGAGAVYPLVLGQTG